MRVRVALVFLVAIAAVSVRAQLDAPFLGDAAGVLSELGFDQSGFKELIEKLAHVEKTVEYVNGEARKCNVALRDGRLFMFCDEPMEDEVEAYEYEEYSSDSEDEDNVYGEWDEYDGNRRNLQDVSVPNIGFNTSSLSGVCGNNSAFTSFSTCVNKKISTFISQHLNETANDTDFQADSETYAQCVKNATAQLNQSSSAQETCFDAVNNVKQIFSQCGQGSNSSIIVSLTLDELSCLDEFAQSFESAFNNGASFTAFALSAFVALFIALL